MHAHRSSGWARFRLCLIALLFPALLALGAPVARAQSYQDATPSLSGGWIVNSSPLAVGGIYYSTFNTQSAASSVAVWSVSLPQAGQYQVLVSSVPTVNVPRTANARYEVTTATGAQLVGGIGQDFSGERLLGTFMLSAGTNAVRLTDLTGEPQLSHTVVANAVRWVLVTGTPTPPPPPGSPTITGYFDFYGNPVTALPPGEAVIITGSNFGFSGSVKFAGFNAPIVRWTPNAIRVLTPLTGSYPTRGPVTVITSSNGTVTGPEFTIDPNAPPAQPGPSTPPGPPTPPSPPPAGTDWPVFGHDPRQLGLADGGSDPRSLQAWNIALGSRPGTSAVIRGGVIYLGTEASGVFAVDAAARGLRWNRPLPAPVRSAPAAGPSVIVVSANGLYGLSAATGIILWYRPDIVANEDVSPMLVNDTVYIGARGPAGGAVMYAVSAGSGANVWASPAPLPGGYDNRATAAVYPEIGLLFAGLGPPAASARPGVGPSSVVALRLADGGPAWATPALFPAAAPPTGLSVGWVASPVAGISPQPAVFMVAGQSVVALNAYTGTSLWTHFLPELALPLPPVVSTAAVQGSILYVAGTSGRVYALDSTLGLDVAGGLTTPVAPITGTMALAGPYLYVPTTAGLVATDARSGVVLWISSLNAASGVVVAGGAPYVATADGRLVGYAASLVPPTNPPPTIPPVNPPVGDYHDLAITAIEAPSAVSRGSDAEVFVQVQNRGSATESFLLRLRVGDIVINDVTDTIASRETKRIRFVWPTGLMGADGAKDLIAQVAILGHTDFNPESNTAVKSVTVGP